MLRITERLNRLSSKQHEDDRSGVSDTKVIESLAGFIRKLLNTRVNTVSMDVGFGIPEIDLSSGLVDEDDRRALLGLIEKLIKTYDKRVKSIAGSLTEVNNIIVVMAFRLQIETREGLNFRLNGRLRADNTFEVESK
ncbi:hypothetical protein N9514_03380 [Pseudomonadales bacterium]|nr:hypothetical protein [Pseudomonadales bacterium]MDA9366135.1 hypothetical protein [Pseudomonadales bacterium]MDB4069056.1 hypothetical protein [Pseudomonadales bacterium]MDB9867771.1 hypothetical protein [Pseudomonadales bacterium]MDB9879842.1 hypothetical protein [Pseudomonadales bacterium]